MLSGMTSRSLLPFALQIIPGAATGVLELALACAEVVQRAQRPSITVQISKSVVLVQAVLGDVQVLVSTLARQV
jgi:hypothetical protein